LNKDVYLGALEALGMVTEFYDFGGCNSVTMNDDNYFEPMHYRPHVGDWMAVRIFGDAGASVPRDFGVLVTRDNLRQHLANMRGMLMSISDSRSNW
jgi:hypothetical protein